MSNPLTSLNALAFSVGGTNLLAVLKMADVEINNEIADGGGLGDRYDLGVLVKQGQQVSFTVFQNNVNGVPDSNLDVSLYTLGGTSYLGALKSAQINAGTKTKDGSSLATGYKKAVPVRTTLEVTSNLMVFTTADLVDLMITGTAAQMSLTAAITFGTTVFSAPMLLKSGKVTVAREEITMEDITLTLKGTPVGPGDASLLGNILLGSSALSLSLDTGGDTYATAGGQYAIITRLNTSISDGAIVEQQGTLELQGALTVSAP